jgi:hypothetical protein
MANVCDVSSPAFDPQKIDICKAGAEDFLRDSEKLFAFRGAATVMAVMENADVTSLETAIKDTYAEIKTKYDAEQVNCAWGNARACGYVGLHDRCVDYFGDLSKVERPQREKKEIKLAHVSTGLLVVPLLSHEGKEVVLDTGAIASFFAPEFLSQFSGAATRTFVQNFDNGFTEKVYQVRQGGIPLSIGGISYNPAFVSELGIFSMLEGSTVKRELVGMVGTDFLFRHVFYVDYDRETFTIDPPIKAVVQKGKWDFVCLSPGPNFGGLVFFVEASLNGRRKKVLIDTGGETSMITETCARELGIRATEGAGPTLDRTGLDISARQTGLTVRISEGQAPQGITLQEVTVEPDTHPNSVQMNHNGVCGTIGLDVLRNFNYLIDPVTATMYLQRRAKKIPEARRLGCVPKRTDKGIEIIDVGSGSPADRAGLKKGDLVVSIDGRKSSDFTILEFRELQYSEANEFVFVVKRGKREMKIVVKR